MLNKDITLKKMLNEDITSNNFSTSKKLNFFHI